MKETSQWKAFEVDPISYSDNWYYDVRIQPQNEVVPEQYQEFLDVFDENNSL
jgi:hypothetical protein